MVRAPLAHASTPSDSVDSPASRKGGSFGRRANRRRSFPAGRSLRVLVRLALALATILGCLGVVGLARAASPPSVVFDVAASSGGDGSVAAFDLAEPRVPGAVRLLGDSTFGEIEDSDLDSEEDSHCEIAPAFAVDRGTLPLETDKVWRGEPWVGVKRVVTSLVFSRGPPSL